METKILTRFITPKNSLQISIELSDSLIIRKINFSGETKAICKYYYAKQQKLEYADEKNSFEQGNEQPK